VVFVGQYTDQIAVKLNHVRVLEKIVPWNTVQPTQSVMKVNIAFLKFRPKKKLVGPLVLVRRNCQVDIAGPP
jgi:hypothetical protein